jgi:hypothetical protein
MPANGSRPSSPQLTSKPSTPLLALNVEQSCVALGVSHDLWKSDIEHEVRIVRLGRRRLIPVSELQRWLDENAESALERR